MILCTANTTGLKDPFDYCSVWAICSLAKHVVPAFLDRHTAIKRDRDTFPAIFTDAAPTHHPAISVRRSWWGRQSWCKSARGDWGELGRLWPLSLSLSSHWWACAWADRARCSLRLQMLG